MIRKAWTASPLLVLLLLLCAAVPPALAAEGEGETDESAPKMSPEARLATDVEVGDLFRPGPEYDGPYNADAQIGIYRDKHDNKTAEPPVQIGRRLYDYGIYKPRPTYAGIDNPVGFHFMAYGDFRVAAAYNDNGVPSRIPGNNDTHQSSIAARLNLDLDLAFTATERIHAFLRPIDEGGSFLRYDIDGKFEDGFVDELDLKLETLFFEGDIGAIRMGRKNEVNMIDLPFAVGYFPVVTQNGIWIEDAFQGFAIGITAKHSSKYDISNWDLTFFTGLNEVDTDAVAGDSDARIFGLAGFADLRQGYLEFGYGYVDAKQDLSYHNLTAAFTRRFGATLSNSVRLIGNFGQDPPPGRRKTADGLLLLIENSLLTSKPITLVPYFNFFIGWDTPQSLARTGDSGGILRNTGINFESDALTGYPTLDARGHDAYGGAIGVEYLFNLDRQLVVEVAGLDRTGDLGRVLGSEYAIGVRYQHPISNALIMRFDVMGGWRDDPLEDIAGARIEIRRKF